MKDEYIRKQDAVEALDGKITVTGHKNADAVLQYTKDITNRIKALPSADVVQVVRCKVCRKHSYDPLFGYWWCNLTLGTRRVKPDDFCSYGEERED